MKNFYLLYSDDKAILNKEIDNIKKSISVNDDDIIYYDINNIEDIVNEAETISMFSSTKLLIIDSFSYLSDKKEINNIKLLENVVDILASGKKLPPKYKNHPLKGKYTGCFDCHILPDWVLIYKIEKDDLILLLVDTGTHSDLFEK